MNFLERITSCFIRPKKEVIEISEKAACPVCWGYQEYDYKIRAILIDKHVDVKNHRIYESPKVYGRACRWGKIQKGKNRKVTLKKRRLKRSEVYFAQGQQFTNRSTFSVNGGFYPSGKGLE